MRTFLALTLLVGAIGCANDAKPTKAAPKSDAEKEAASSLKVGDPAPALKADKWLHGDAVPELAAGKVYVVEFWATWCGPCIVMMPHLGELQAQYRDRGVTFIGYTVQDPNNSAEKVADFVAKRGPKLGYTFAYSDGRDTYDAWMKASGRNGIPCSFVVDQKGKIAYIGHPMFLDLVLPKVLAGTWGSDELKKLDDVEQEINEVFQMLRNPDAEAGLKALTGFEAKYPPLAHLPYFVAPKLDLLLKVKRFDSAKKMAEEVMEQAIKQEDPKPLNMVASVLAAANRKDLGEVALKAAQAGLKLAGDKDIGSLMGVAEAYFATGNKAKAREYGAKAIAAADNERTKSALQQMMKKYEDASEEKKDDKP